VSARPVLRRGAAYSLLGATAAVIAPHAARMPMWLTLLVSACLLWQAAATARGWKPIGRWLLAALSVCATAAVVFAFGPIPGRDGSVSLLVLMAGLKCLELRSVRDGHVATLLGYFLIVTHFLYLQSAPFALFLGCVLLWLIATTVAFQDRNGSLKLGQVTTTAGVLVAAGLPVALVLFLLFPRVEGPLFGTAAAAGSATTGLSERMSPGDISDLGMSDEVAFRVDFGGTSVHPSELYWRGPVLWDFDGRTWRTSAHAGNRTADHVRGARPVNYRITLEPHRHRWLFALDAPAVAPANAALGSDLLLRAEQPVRARLRYAMRSNLDYRVGVEESEHVLRRAMQLPPRFNPRTTTLAARMRAKADTQADLVKAALELFRREQFFYTLSPQALGRDSVDEFLFGTRRGFCEHYASAFVVLMRSAGVPARIVTGYQGGEHNRLGNYLVVRQSHAHAWAEVWLKGQGWVRVDPTAAVVPERVQTGSPALWIEQGRAGLEATQGLPAWVDLGQLFDHMTRTWNDWVLDYSPERQRSLLQNMGLGQASWPLIGAIMAAFLAIAAAIGAAMTLREWRHPRDRIHLAYLRFCDKLARIGCERQEHEGPCDFARRAIEAHPALAEPIERITEAYVRFRYAEGPAAPAQLEALVHAFTPERRLRQSGARY